MIEATSCGGVVIFRGKILLLYKNYRNKYEGWVLPKGTVEEGEQHNETALREVKEETGVSAQIIKYVGKSNYTFNTSYDVVNKDVHWYLMMADSYYSKPQREEYFMDSGYYKYHEAYHLLKFPNEKQILDQAYEEYTALNLLLPFIGRIMILSAGCPSRIRTLIIRLCRHQKRKSIISIGIFTANTAVQVRCLLILKAMCRSLPTTS